MREEGGTAGIAVNPGTAVSAVEGVLDEVDLILVMTVDPGFAGRPFQQTSLARIAAARALADGRHVEIDGGVGPDNIGKAAAAGANYFVAASSIFKGPYDETIANLRQLAEEGARSAQSG